MRVVVHCVTTVAPAKGRKYPHLSELYTPFLLIPVLPFATSMTLKTFMRHHVVLLI
mgnify:CR=1 FL=1